MGCFVSVIDWSKLHWFNSSKMCFWALHVESWSAVLTEELLFFLLDFTAVIDLISRPSEGFFLQPSGVACHVLFPLAWTGFIICARTHSGAPHIENLKSTPCGQFYFNSPEPRLPSRFRPHEGFGCRFHSKGWLDLVITAVSGVVLAHVPSPEIIYSFANWTANRQP